MQTSYIYSVSRVNALAQFLLSKNDIERLFVAEAGTDLQSALKETYLAPYLTHVPNDDVSLAIEETLIQAKKLVHGLAPKGDMFRVLWVQYDIHNLRVLAKASAKQMSLAEIKPFLSSRGIYEAEYLATQAENNSLNNLQTGWQEAYVEAVEMVSTGNISAVDGIFDNLYFTTCQRMVDKTGDAFIKQYLARKIDLYNIKSRLRHLKNEGVKFTPAFVKGGTFWEDKTETLEDTLATLAALGPADFFKEGIEYYQTTGNTTKIDVLGNESLLTLAKEASHDMFSSASLVLYYLKCRQAAANIRTIVVGKNSGMSESDIRFNLSLAYVNN